MGIAIRVATDFFPSERYTEAITYIGGCGMEIRPEMVLLMNFLVDFLLIIGTNRICGHPYGFLRAAIAAAIGAAYTAGCLMPGFGFLQGLHWRVIFTALLCMVAFGWTSSTLRRSLLLILLRMAMGGIALGVGKGGFWTVVMAALSICLMCLLGMDGRSGRQFLPVFIIHQGRTIQLTALVDTGNSLRDPVSGWPVLVTDARAAYQLLGLTEAQLQKPVEAIASCGYKGLRLIPYNTVGQSNGLLLGLRVEQLWIDGRREEMIVAFAPQRIGQGKTYQALAGGNMV